MNQLYAGSEPAGQVSCCAGREWMAKSCDRLLTALSAASCAVTPASCFGRQVAEFLAAVLNSTVQIPLAYPHAAGSGESLVAWSNATPWGADMPNLCLQVHTYGAGPVFTVLERELISKVRYWVADSVGSSRAMLLGGSFLPQPEILLGQVAALAGFDSNSADGVFAPGVYSSALLPTWYDQEVALLNSELTDVALCSQGSYSNMTALLVARNKHFPHVVQEGWQAGDCPLVYTSVQARDL
jgi:hypothetical protein